MSVSDTSQCLTCKYGKQLNKLDVKCNYKEKTYVIGQYLECEFREETANATVKD